MIRVVIWCVNEWEIKTILERSDLYKGREFLAKIMRWNMFLHWEYVQIEAKFSWIRVDGLPLNLWNLDTFKLIGEACGGLLEVARETSEQTFLMYAKLKVKGHMSGFLDPIVGIPCEDEIVHVGLFSLSPNKIHEIYSSAITRAILARNGNGGDSRSKQSGNGLGPGLRKVEEADMAKAAIEKSLIDGDKSEHHTVVIDKVPYGKRQKTRLSDEKVRYSEKAEEGCSSWKTMSD